MKKLVISLGLSVIMTFGAVAQSMNVDTEKAVVSYSFVAEKVTGTVTGFDAEIKFDLEDLTNSQISGTVDATTLTSGNKMRDKHLQADDYFNTKEFPTMSFKSSSITKTDKGYSMVGMMSIKGKEVEQTINFTHSEGSFIGKAIIFTNDFEIASKKNREESKVLLKFDIPVK